MERISNVRLGYVSQSLTLGLGTSRTCRVANASPARLEALIAENLAALERILLFNAAHGIEVFRIGSSLVPLASHPVNRLRWWRTFARDFQAIGRLATRTRHRLSMHPSPAGASLSSISPKVRAAAVAELEYSTRVLDLLGQDADARVVVHLGGAQPDRATALRNAHEFLARMPVDASRRLAVEHDDRVWTAREAYEFAASHDLPFVADTLHHAVLPSDPPLELEELLHLAAEQWRALGLRPKHHVASQREGARPGTHADFISEADRREVFSALRDPADLMLEAKAKDRAVLALLSRMRSAEAAAIHP